MRFSLRFVIFATLYKTFSRLIITMKFIVKEKPYTFYVRG